MQLTMNSNEVSVPSDKANRFVSWFGNAVNKISAVFTKKERPAVDSELTEAIRVIEWRTRYDQYRIVNHVYTLTALVQSQELCTALGVKEPTYTSQRFKNDRMNRFLLTSRTQELMLNEWGCDSYGIRTVNIIKTDNTFERKLVRWFGELNPTTKQLIDGKSTTNQRWLKKNARITELYLNRLPMHGTSSKSLNGHEQQMLNALIASVTTVHISTAPVLLLPGTVDLVQSEPEQIEVAAIDVVVETLPVEEVEQPIAVEQPAENKATTLTEAEKLEKTIKGLKKLSLPDLKKFAIANNIHIRGKMTQITSIREKIIRELRKQATSES